MTGTTLRQAIEQGRSEDRSQTVIGLAIETGQPVPSDITVADLAAFLTVEFTSLWGAIFMLADQLDTIN